MSDAAPEPYRQLRYYREHRRHYIDYKAAVRRDRKADGRCYDCNEPAREGRTRCRECAKTHRLKQRHRLGSTSTVTCGGCGETGHNRRTCERAA